MNTCENPNCQNLVPKHRRFCSKLCTYAQNRGCPEPPPIPGARWLELGGGRFALIDEDLYSEASKNFWSKNRKPNGKIVAHRYHGGKRIKLHQWVIRKVLGSQVPEGMTVDHVNGDHLICTRANLRLANHQEQAINRRSVSKATGFRGVYKTRSGKFKAQLSVGGRSRTLKTFGSAIEAAEAYDQAARAVYRSFACLNFPRDGEQGATPLEDQLDIRANQKLAA